MNNVPMGTIIHAIMYKIEGYSLTDTSLGTSKHCAQHCPLEVPVVLQHLCNYRYTTSQLDGSFCFLGQQRIKWCIWSDRDVVLTPFTKWQSTAGDVALGRKNCPGMRGVTNSDVGAQWKACAAQRRLGSQSAVTLHSTLAPRTVNQWGDWLQRPDYKSSKTCWPCHTAARHVLSVTYIFQPHVCWWKRVMAHGC